MKLIITLSIFLVATISTFGQTSFPQNDVGEKAKSFLHMLSTTTDDDLRSFLKNEMTPNNEMSPEDRFEFFQRFRKDLSASTLQEIVDASEHRLSFLVKTGQGRIMQIVLEIAPDQGNRISEIGLVMSPGGGGGPRGPKVMKEMPKAGFIPSVESYLNDVSKADKFSGVVLIAKEGKPIFQKGYGYANKEFRVPNQMDSKFNIGSLNKMFTAYAIGLLADEGKLSFDDPIGKHLPDYPNKDAAKKATIYHLLTMSSGIGDIFSEEYDATPKDKLRKISDYFPLFQTKPLEFEPGTNQQYSNGGFLVLGAIIEKVSGKSYYEFVRERIFNRAGMNDTDSYATDEVTPNLVQGYTRGEFGKTEGKRINNIYTLPARGSSAGGGYSTALDLLKFVNAVNSGKLPVPESMKKSRGIMDADMFQRGFRTIGGSLGVNSLILSRLPGNHTVIVLSNYDVPVASEVGMQISEWINK